MLTRYNIMCHLCVGLSVYICSSDTSRSATNTAKRINMQTTQYIYIAQGLYDCAVKDPGKIPLG